MKKLILFMSIILTVSLIFTSAYASLGNAISGNTTTTLINDFATSGLTTTGNGATLNVVTSGTLQAINNNGEITVTADPNTTFDTNSYVRFNLNDYPIRSTTHDGTVTYELKVNASVLPGKLGYGAYVNDGSGFAFAEEMRGNQFGAGYDYVIGLVYDTTTGAYYTTCNGNKYDGTTGKGDTAPYSGTVTDPANGLKQIYFEIKFNATTSVKVSDAKVTYQERYKLNTGYLFNGLPQSGLTKTENNVNLSLDVSRGGTAENNNGEITITNPKESRLNLGYTVTPDDLHKASRIYYEYTLSFTTVPSVIKFNAYKAAGGWTSIGPELIQSKKWQTATGTMTASPNVKWTIGFLYDVDTGAYETFINGTPSVSGSADADGGISTLWIDFTDTDGAFTFYDAKVIYIADNNFDEDVFADGIEPTSRKTWDYGNGVSINGYGNTGVSFKNNIGELEITGSAPTDSRYARIYFNFDEALTAEAYSDGNIYFECRAQFSAAPNSFKLFSVNGTSDYVDAQIDAAVFSDTSKEYTITFVYNLESGEYYSLVDGVPTRRIGKVEGNTAASQFYLDITAKNPEDVITITNLKAGYIPGVDSVGALTLDNDSADIAITCADAYSSLGSELTVIIAQYNDDNELVSVVPIVKPLSSGSNNISVAYVKDADASVVKAFVWDGLNRFATPLTASVSK